MMGMERSIHRKEDQGLCSKGLKTALVHAAINWRDKERNLAKLLALNKEAADAGARIILNTELATTGYAFESRDDIAPLTETIPGPTTDAFGRVSREYECHICIGMPEVDANTGIFYNSAALLGPDGCVEGICRKASPAFRENLWAARGNLPVAVVETELGGIGVIICADSYSYKPARSAALNGARILLVPANWPPQHHNPEKFWRARAAENGIYVLACNRTGTDKVMDCRLAESFIIDANGGIVKKFSSQGDAIIYGTIPLVGKRLDSSASEAILGRRRPHCYGSISLDAFSHINHEALLNLPKCSEFTVAALQFRSSSQIPMDNAMRMIHLIDEATIMAAARGMMINLVILPELSTTGLIPEVNEAERWSEEIPGNTTDIFAQAAREKNIFIVLGMAEREAGRFYNSSILIGPNGVAGKYRKVHLSSWDEGWAEAGPGGFQAFDLPFARIGMLIGHDLIFPEAADSLAKLGADILCVPALWGDAERKFIWEARLGEQMHLAIANQWGNFGRLQAGGESLLCNYSRYSERISRLWSPSEGDAINIMTLCTKDAREKRFLENIDYGVLLDLNGTDFAAREIKGGQKFEDSRIL